MMSDDKSNSKQVMSSETCHNYDGNKVGRIDSEELGGRKDSPVEVEGLDTRNVIWTGISKS